MDGRKYGPERGMEGKGHGRAVRGAHGYGCVGRAVTSDGKGEAEWEGEGAVAVGVPVVETAGIEGVCSCSRPGFGKQADWQRNEWRRRRRDEAGLRRRPSLAATGYALRVCGQDRHEFAVRWPPAAGQSGQKKVIVIRLDGIRGRLS